ncbi:PREDICTED: sodium-dependent nutrient amino acid transporter 1-like [Dufourea novaeangliae]|uniref:sodium-dependent nutrient amino acid transporter 1-like n=1 Tax=Dufourea novaeangliae TaxID=178035 RepID=UPI000767842C|nr:PREDICTED: sodium-dependent nutrient amino acid transporter 1-like [Dufourea novaeangliae]
MPCVVTISPSTLAVQQRSKYVARKHKRTIVTIVTNVTSKLCPFNELKKDGLNYPNTSYYSIYTNEHLVKRLSFFCSQHGKENAAFVGDDGVATTHFQNRNVNTITEKIHGSDTFGFQYGIQDDRKSPIPVSIPEEMSIAENGEQRATWGNGLEFLMSCIAMSIGLGNVWRFPFTAYENGGGVFLIPYIIVLFVVGKPFYYLEMIMGQFCSRSSVKMWAAAPGFRGVGWAQMFSMLAVGTYYCSLMSVTLYYLIGSFQSKLPWSTCHEEWEGSCVDSGGSYNVSQRNGTVMISSAELYFRKIVLKEKQTIDDGIGTPDWKLTICLLVSWLCIFAVLARGVKSSGKAAYFLALFPYVIMISLLIRAVTLDGAVNGIIFFIKPNWRKLFDANVWYAAVTQCFFSLSVCFGGVVMYSSYNDFRHNIYRDVIVVTTLDTFTSLMAGFTIFGILGNLAHELGTDDISNVVRGGTGLAFVSYPDAIAKFTVLPQLFSVLFFLMLYVLGIGSAIALAGAIVTIITDQFPNWKHFYVVLGTATFGFFGGTVYCTPGGQFILELVDYYGGSFIVFILATLEITGIFWVYGLENFVDDVEYMLKRRPSMYWRLCWAVITPVLLAVILVYTLATLRPLTYSGISYPDSAHVAGWSVCAFGALQVPFWFVYTIMSKRDSKLSEMIGSAIRPSSDWGPKNTRELASWREFKETKRKIREKRDCSTFKQFVYVILCWEEKLV